MLAIQHSMNPLHIYCRLMDMGLKRRGSWFLIRYYEILIYRWLVAMTRIFIFIGRYRQHAFSRTGLEMGQMSAED